VRLFSPLTGFTGGQSVIEVNGNTIASCLRDLIVRFPKIKRMLFDRNDILRPWILISVNKQSITREGLDKLLKDGDELYIIIFAEGG
jgi:molybdopterin converting factor small subunit